MIVSILLFLLIISLIIIGHEYGHYMIARTNGIRVIEFDVGMGPELASFQRGETKFCLRALPLGGACLFDGMDVLEDGELAPVDEKDERAFPNAPVGRRIATILAGPMANFIMGLVLAMIIVAFTGTDLPVIGTIMENSAAEEAGLATGDMIRSINGRRIHVYREVSLASSLNYGEPLDIVYERDGEVHEITLVPRYDEEDGRYYIGLIGSGEYMRCGALQVFQYGFYEAQYWVRVTLDSLAQIFRGRFKLDDLSGPVGVAQVVDETYEAARPYGFSVVLLSMLNLATLLTINLGIMNLLPVPALDGGRLLLLIVELIRGKKLSPKSEGYVTAAGAIALVALMVVVLVNDITKFFR